MFSIYRLLKPYFLMLLIVFFVFSLFFSVQRVYAESSDADSYSATEQTAAGQTDSQLNQELALDENVDIDDLDINEPKFLPDNPFYFLKNWKRSIQYFFAFDPVKKIELKERFANERLFEVKKLIQKGVKDSVIKKSLQSYQDEIDSIDKSVDKIKEKSADNPKISRFLDKFIKHQFLHEKILERLESQVPKDIFQNIKTVRERHLEKFSQVMTKLENRKDRLARKIEKVLNNQKGSKFKHIKSLEILKLLKDKTPEQSKKVIEEVEENTLRRLKNNLEKMSPEDQEKFDKYINRISGNREKQLEILEDLKASLPKTNAIKDKIQKARIKVLRNIQQNVEKDRTIKCPVIKKPDSNFCLDGRIVVEKDAKGCPINFKCIKGVNRHSVFCQLFWFYDDTHRYCRQKRFCGLYMYKGLKTFKTEKECNDDLRKAIKQSLKRNKSCRDLCGDGVCQSIVCQAVGCPCSETKESCPQDCQ